MTISGTFPLGFPGALAAAVEPARPARVPRLRMTPAASKLAPVASSASDQDLLLAVGRQDRDACRELVERHLDRVLAFCERMLGNRGEAEEVAQEVFVRVWTKAATWKPMGAKVTTWLFRIAKNLCLNRIARRRESSLEDAREPREERKQAEGLLEESEIGEHVRAALADLPENQRIAITLCHYQGWKNSEAAEMMEVSVEAVESLLARGRRGLKKRLAEIAPALLRGES